MIDYPLLRNLADIEAIEKTPLEQQVFSWDVNNWIRHGVSLDPAKVALEYFETADPASEPQRITYAALGRQIVQAANLFHALGVTRDDAVIALMPTLPQLYVTLLGGIGPGIACGLNWMLKPPQVLELIRASKAKVVVVQGPTPGFEIWENFSTIAGQLDPGVTVLTVPGPGGSCLGESDFETRLAPQPDHLTFTRKVEPNDIAAYIHSGGTTDSPKLVKITHRGLSYKLWVSNLIMAHQPEDVIFADYPIFHVAGFYNRCVGAVADGMRVVMPTALGARNKDFIARYWKFVDRCGVTILAGVPTTLSVLAKNPPREGENISSLRPYMPTGSTGMPIEVAREIERITGVRCLLTYGATEYTANVTQAPRDGDVRFGSAGIRIPYTHLRIVKLAEGGAIERDCATDEIGVVLIKGPGITPGYVDERFNAGLFSADGWFISGDLGRIDDAGYLWLTGRVKDVIIRGGHNIDAVLIEDVLRRHPAVLLCAAVGKPDAYAGELPVAYVQPLASATVTADELKSFVRAEITERAGTPDEIFLIDPLPLTDIGKPNKALLRQDAAARTFKSVLGAALGGAADVAVEVAPDKTHGTLATIRVAGPDAERPALEAKIAEVMKAYTIQHRIAWSAR